MFPTVTIDGQVLFDGGVADNTPISQAVAAGADRVVVLPAGVACALPHPPRSALAVAVHALTLLIEQRLMLDVAAYHDQVDLVVLPPLCPLTFAVVGLPTRRSLIDRAAPPRLAGSTPATTGSLTPNGSSPCIAIPLQDPP